MKRLALVVALLPVLAAGGDFVTNPATTLPGPKIDGKPVPSGADTAKILRATDFNALRDAALDLRDYVRAPNAAQVTATGTGVTKSAAEWMRDGALVTATGATAARDGRDRASDAWTPRDFSCVGDGVADDRACLQSWLNAGSLWKRPLVGDGRTYRVGGSASLTVGSDTTIDGRGMVLRPDASMNVPLIYAWGSAGARLSNVSIRGIRMDGTSRPADSSGGFGAFWFGFLDNLTVRDCSWSLTHDATYLRAVERFTISGLKVVDSRSAIVALLAGTKRGTISDLEGVDTEEVVDFFDNEDVSVSNFTATGATGRADEAFDVSTSRRISISNGSLTGFYYGIHLKTEAGQADPAVSWEDVIVKNVTIREQLAAGIFAQASVTTYGPARRLRVSGVSIVSSVAGSSGISLSPPAGGQGGFDATFDQLVIDTPGIGLYAYQFSGVRLRDSKIKAGTGYAVQFTLGSNPDLVVTGNEIEATGGATGDAALYVENSNDVRVERNTVKSTTGTAIRVANSQRPSVRDNVVAGAGMYGVYVNWTSTAAIDIRSTATITGNLIRDWGQAATARNGIYVQVANVTAALEGLNVSDNVATLSDAATVQTQYPFYFALGTATLARSKYANNTAGARVPNEAFGASSFNADGVWGNVPATTASVYQGTGSPEGVVVAKIGSFYLRRDGTRETRLYVKNLNDTLSTGWVLVGTQAAAHTDPADSPAALTDAVTKANFNALLAKLRAAGVLAP